MSLTQWLDVSSNRGIRHLIDAGRRHLGGRRGVLIATFAVLAVGMALNWSWLVAAGIAPLLLAALPCAAMCALGLCMNRMTGQSCSSGTADRSPSEPQGDASEPLAPSLSPKVDPASRPTAETAQPRPE